MVHSAPRGFIAIGTAQISFYLWLEVIHVTFALRRLCHFWCKLRLREELGLFRLSCLQRRLYIRRLSVVRFALRRNVTPVCAALTFVFKEPLGDV